MFRRIKLLTLLQLSDRFKLKKVENKKILAARIGIFIFSLIILTAVCTGLIYVLCDIIMIPKTYNLMTFVILLLQVMSVIACTNGLLKTLYLSKDNQILLSYPAHHVEVFLSKLLVFYIYEFIKGLFLLIPLLLGFGIIFDILSIAYVGSIIVMMVILPLFPVLIGAFLTMPVLLINKVLNRYQIVKAVLIIALLALLFIVVYKIMGLIPVPLRIVALYNSFIMKVTEFISNVNRYSLFYMNIGKIMVGENAAINYLIVIAVLLGLLLVVASLAMPLYFVLASKSNEQANEKKHKGVNIAHKNTFFTFVKKEWLLSIRNLSDFINNYSFMFATPYVLYIMVSIFSAIDRNELGHHMTIAFAGFIALMLASASNTSSALAITQEGSEFVLLKTVPSDAANMCWAKIFFNLVFSSIMLIISFIVIGIFCNRIVDQRVVWLMLVAVLLVNAGLIFWSFQIDIMSPKLREYASNSDSSSINNASLSIKVGLIITLGFTILSILFLLDGQSFIWSWGRIIGIALAFLVARFYMFRSYLKNVFPDIEF